MYESLSGNGYDLGSYEDFDQHADEKETREWLYNAGKESGLELGSYADFDKGMGHVSSPSTSVAQQVIDEYDRANQSSMTTAPVLNDNSVSPQRQLNQSSGEAEKALFADYVREQLGNIDNELNKPREALPMPAGSAFIPSTAVAAAQRYGNAQTREQQDRYTSLRAARNFLDDANKLVTEAGKKGKTNFVAGALRGLRDKGFDPDTWMMGISETAYYNLLRQAAEKEERGEQLSAEEQQLLDAAAVNMAANAYYAQDLGRGYKAGAVTAESIPFMLQFALNPVSGAGKGIAKTILEHGIKRFGLNTAKRTAAGRAVRGAARMAGDAVAAAGVTATTGLGNVAEDASRRMTGDVQFAENADGNIRYAGRENNVDTGEAIARAFTSTFFENQSEMVGNYFAPVMRGVSGLVKRLPGIKQLSASKVGEIYRGIKNNPTYKEFTDRTQWHGAIGEYAEEVYNNLASVAMGDMTPEQLVDLDNNIDTFLGVGLMSAVFGGIGAAGFARDRYTLNRDVKRFESTLSPDEVEHWQEVKRVAQNGDVEGVREFVKYTLRDDSLTPQEKKDEIKYIYDVMQQSAMENVAAEQTEEAVQAETDDIVANSDPQTNTYTECSRLVMNEVGEMVEVPGHIVGYMGGQPLWKPDGAGPEVEAVALKEGEYNPESVRSMPTQEVIDETAQAIREDAAAQAQRESTYSPDIVPPSIGTTFTDGAAQYKIAQQNPDNPNGGWLATRTTVDEKGKSKEEVVEITDEQYYNAMQAQIDAQETSARQEQQPVSSTNQAQSNGQSGSETAPSSLQGETSPGASETIIPTDEKGNLLYHRAPVDRTVSSINSEGLEPDEVDAFVQANKDASAKLMRNIKGKAPKMGTNIAQYKKAKQEWQARVDDAQAQVDYWNQVADAIQSQRTQVGDATAEDILSMGEPMDGHELAAQMLATGKLPLLQADFKRETGYKGDEARSLFGLFASEANGGMTIERAGEQLMLADQEAGTNFFDQSDPNAGRNAILDVLSEVRTRGDLTNYIRRNREAMAERERQAEYDAYADWCEREMHMTPEEYEAYQEYVVANNPYEGVAVEELDRIFAEAEEEIQTYLNQQDNGQQGTSENGSSPDSGPSERDEPAGTAGSREAGVSVLPEAQPVLPGQVQGRTEGAASQPGTADDGVRAEERAVSEGASGGEGIENQINDENNEINVVSSQSNQNDTENEQGEVAGISGESSSLDGENEAATILRRAGDRTAASDGRGSWTKESLLGDVVRRSKESQTWIEDIQSIAGKHLLRGGENDVYLSNDGKSVIKVNDFSYLPDNSTNFDSFMNRVDAHNELFPNDSITVLGFTRNSEGMISVVLSQPYISNAREATQEEIDNFLEGMDFYTDMSGNWTDGTFDIADTKPNNVLVDADGNLHFIDVLPYDSRKPGKMLVIPPTRNAFVAPEREEGENLLDYAERVVKTKEIDDARKEVSANPTDAQKEAGNYRKGHITLDGYDITIENPKRSTRSGVDANGQSWSVTMNNDYGYIRGTEGVDGDHIDVFLSDDPTTGKVYVIDQVNADGSFDEHKVMYGFKSALAAKRAYLANYSPGWKGLGTISEISKEEFKKWIESSHRKTKPFAEYKSVKVEGEQNEKSNSLQNQMQKRYRFFQSFILTKDGKLKKKYADAFNNPVYAVFDSSKPNSDPFYIASSPRDALNAAFNYDIENFDVLYVNAPEKKVELGVYSLLAYGQDASYDSEGTFREEIKQRLAEDIRKLASARLEKPKENNKKKIDGEHQNRLVTEERYAELKKRMQQKLRGQMNMGIDPEILAIGTEMAVYHIEKGARKFAEYAKAMIADLGDAIRPYLKSFYNGARDLPEVQEARLTDDMDSYDEVSRFDVANFDKDVPNVLDMAETIAKEQEVQAQAGVAKEKIARKRASKKKVKDKSVPLSLNDLFTQTEESNEQGSTEPDSSLGGRARQETERTEQRGTGGSVHGHHVPDEDGSRRVPEPAGTSSRQPVVRNQRNYRFGEEGIQVPQGDIAKLKANVEAIRTLKEIEASGQPATEKQKEILSRYVGWGGLADALNEDKYNARNTYYKDANWNSKYLTYYEQLRELLSEEEFQSAVQSTTTSHYTPTPVIRALWSIVQRSGFLGGVVSEPAMGVGHIIGLMPVELFAQSRIGGYEIDSLSGRIASHLYPDADVKVQGYETNFAPQSKDLVITNVPFGRNAPYDKNLDRSLKRELGNAYNLHNYFIAKSLLELKEGGLGVFVTSSATMDGSDSHFREFVAANNIDLVGAIRLPNNAFLQNAGTSVTADILVFRKRKSGEPSNGIGFVSTTQIGEGTYEENGETRTKPILVNEYFAEYPNMMLGEMMTAFDAGSGGLYSGASQTLKPKAGANLAEELEKAVAQLPENILSKEASSIQMQEREETSLKNGTITTKKGKVYVAVNGELVPVDAKDAFTFNGKERRTADAVADYNALKDTLQKLISAEQSEEEDPKALRKQLNEQYDAFVQKYGTLNRNKPLDNIFAEDYEHNLPLSLEEVARVPSANGKKMVWQVKKGKGILERRVSYPINEPTTADSLQDAVNISLSYKGTLDISYMARLMDETEEQVTDEILERGDAYRDPITGALVDRDTYLSGNVREKLEEARAAAENNPDYQKNVEDLMGVQPETIRFGDISYRLGTPWIPVEYINDFAESVLGITGADVSYEPLLNEFVVSRRAHITDFAKSGLYKTERMNTLDLFTNALNQRKPNIFDEQTTYGPGGKSTIRVPNEAETQAVSEKIMEISDKFIEYIDGRNEIHRELERIYNDKYNNYRLKKYSLPSFSHAETDKKGNKVVVTHYPGSNASISLREHQAKAVQRSLHESTLLAHQVGTGKTFTMITTAMEMRRLGLARKPMIVVQNATLEDFVKDFYRLYPSANVLAPSKDERSAENRKRLFNLIATGDFDAIVIPQSFLGFIPDDEGRKKELIQKRIDEYLEAIAKTDDYALQRRLQKEMQGLRENLEGGDSKKSKKSNVKEKAKAADRAKSRAERVLDRRTDDVMSFEKLGIDALFIDEAHNFKKIGFATKMNNVKGVDSGASQRANSLLLKARWVQEKNGGRNVILATGTPITNTMAEVWTMMNFVSPDILNAYNIRSFDDFATTFGTVEPSLEFTATGNFKIADRFKSYVNVPELLKAFRSHADVVLTEDVKEFQQDKNIPKLAGGKMENIVIDKNEDLEDVMDMLVRELEDYNKLTGQAKREKSALPLVVFTKAKQAAIDLRLLNPSYADNPNSKTNQVVRNIVKLYKESTPDKGTQLVFCDSYQSPGERPKMDLFDYDPDVPRFNLYEDMKEKLVAAGIPANEIAIVNNYDGDRRKVLFEKVRNGDVRILLGSTEKMGVGVNVQDRLYALHHVDAPLRPMDFEQRNGRILRQGNLYATWDKPVHVLTYGVQGTLDATAYDRLRVKQEFINQMMKGNTDSRVMEEQDDEDPSGMTFSQMAATLSGDKTAQLLFAAQNKLKRLRNSKRSDANSKSAMDDSVESAKRRIKLLQESKNTYEKATRVVDEYFPNGVKKVEVNGQSFIEKLGSNLDPIIDAYDESYSLNRGIAPLKLNLNDGAAEVVVHYNEGRMVYELYAGKEHIVEGRQFNGGRGLMSSIGHQLDVIKKNLADIESNIQEQEKKIEGLTQAMNTPWGREEELKEAEKEVEDLQKQLEEKAKENSKEHKRENTINEEEANDLYRIVDDESEIERLNSEPTVKVYRAMSLVDGKLYPPMSKKIGTGSNRISQAPSEFGQWEVSDERPQLVEKEGAHKNHIYIVKDNGKGLWVAYNPYFHTSRNPLNDQFAEAYKRPNLVTVEVEVPESELTSGYQAEGAKDPVGETKWNAGPVNRQLSGDKKRKVILSRWMRPVRIVPDSEVAQRIAELIEGENVAIPDNTVTPSLLEELKNLGVKIVDGINKGRKKASDMMRNGNGALNDYELSNVNDPIAKMLGQSTRTVSQRQAFAERERGYMIRRAENLARKLHLNNVEIVTDVKALSGRRAKAKGFYNRAAGKITIVIPNHTSEFDVAQTLLHEAVAHYGLRQLFGEHFDTFLDNVYNNADLDVRRKIVELAKKNGWDTRLATEEYLASLAEETNFEDLDASWWRKIKELFLRMLHKIGFNDFNGVTLSDNELRYILWRSYENLAEPGRYRSILGEAADVVKQHELKVGNYAQVPAETDNAAEGANDLYRETPDGQTSDDGSRDAYNRAVTGNRFKAQEAYQDSMLALKRLQEVVEKYSGSKLKSYENAYMAENQMSSKSTRETEVYGDKFFKPMLQEVANLIQQGAGYSEIIDYMVAKHGLERNEVFAEQDAAQEAERRFEKLYKELEQLYKLGGVTQADCDKRKAKIDAEKEKYYRKRLEQHLEEDYSGLTALRDRQKVVENYPEGSPQLSGGKSSTTLDEATPKEFARLLVNEFERRFDTRSLWDKVNAATKETLRKSYESGMMSRDTYDKVGKMFKHYIPLRGWDEQTAEDVYEYLNSETSPVNSVLKSAKGRRSMSDDPLATIGNMAESAILQGNRNLMKQNFLNMAINHPTDVLTVREAWYVKDPSTGEWVLSFPDIEENDDADTIARKVEEHEERMNMLKENGEATQVKEGLNIDYRISARQAKEHIVNVKRNGKDYLIFVNGSPRAAQAVNGLTNPSVEPNKMLEGISRFNRQLAANFTNRNPAFVLSNLSRDLIFAVSAVNIKEGGAYARRFAANIPRAMRVIARNLRGKGDANHADDALFEEFLDNGGETGYTSLHSVDEYKRMVSRELNRITGKRDYFRAVRASAQFFSMMNRWAEDVSRFTTYMTSREQGKTISESVNDAKEVTVNFNKKGAGVKTSGVFGWTSGLFRNLYLFFNAAVQSLANFSRLSKKNPKAFYTTLGGFTAAGFLVPVLNGIAISMLGGDDDDYYGNLPEWVRRNNLCLYAGNGKFITIPLPIELRAFYGLGEMAYQAIISEDTNGGDKIAYQAINQITELLPINPLGNNGDLVTTLMPDVISPFWQIYENKDFTGKPIYRQNAFNETMPEWTKAYNSTSDWLVKLSEWTNELAGGDKYKQADVLEPIMNWNPAKVEHLFESYFGGMAKTFNQAAKTLAGGVESVINGEKSDNLQWYSTPVLNRFFNDASDDRSAFSKVNERYYKLYDLYEEVGKELRGYGREAARGDLDYLDKLNRLYQSDDYKKYLIFKRNKRIIDRIRDMEKKLPEEATKEKEELQKKVAEMKRSLLEQIDNLK